MMRYLGSRQIASSLLFTILVSWPSGANARVSAALDSEGRQYFRYEMDSFFVEEYSRPDGVRSKVVLRGGEPLGIPGSPEVPVLRFLVKLPHEGNVRVSVDRIATRTVPAKQIDLFPFVRDIVPNPEISRLLADRQPIPLRGRGKSRLVPELSVELLDLGFSREQRLGVLVLAPLQYDIEKSLLVVHDEIEFRIIIPGEGDFPPEDLVTSREFTKFDNAIHDGPRRAAGRVDNGSTIIPEPIGGLRIGVREKGLYRLVFDDLSALSVNVPISADDIRLTTKAGPLPIFLQGSEDGIFDRGDWILFYLDPKLSAYDDLDFVHIFLAKNGTQPKISIHSTTPQRGASPGTLVSTFTERVIFEDDRVYLPAAAPEAGGQVTDTLSHWYSTTLATGEDWSFLFDCPGLVEDPVIETTMRVCARSRMKIRDHRVVVSLNGRLIEDSVWQGNSDVCRDFVVPVNTLLSSGNQFAASVQSGDDEVPDVILVDSIGVSYERQLAIGEGQTRFEIDCEEHQGPRWLGIRGFSPNEAVVMDITEIPYSLMHSHEIGGLGHLRRRVASRLLPVQCGQSGGVARFAVSSFDELRIPVSIDRWTLNDISSSLQGADTVVIAADRFVTAVERDFPRSAGERFTVIPVSAVFDQFGHGARSPESIRQFLKYAYSEWPGRPIQRAILVGDASFDYRCRLSDCIDNHVPTFQVSTWINGDTGSDHWFSCVRGEDALPDIEVSRIPASDQLEFEAFLNQRREAIENAQKPQSALFVVDDGFEPDADDLVVVAERNGLIAIRLNISGQADPTEFRKALFKEFERENDFVVFVGHGGRQVWAHEGVLWYEELLDRDFDARFGGFLGVTCLNGFFDFPFDDEIIVEGWIASPTGGGAWALAPSRLQWATDGKEFGEIFVDSLLANRLSPSAAHMMTKTRLLAFRPWMVDSVFMNNLFGY